MILIAPRAHAYVEEAAAHLAKFRRKVAGLHGNFLNRVDAGLYLRGSEIDALISGVHALHAICLRVGGRTVYFHIGVGLIESAGHQRNHVIRIANTGAARRRASHAVNREFGQHLRRNVLADVGSFCFQLRRVRSYRDRFGSSTHF